MPTKRTTKPTLVPAAVPAAEEAPPNGDTPPPASLTAAQEKRARKAANKAADPAGLQEMKAQRAQEQEQIQNQQMGAEMRRMGIDPPTVRKLARDLADKDRTIRHANDKVEELEDQVMQFQQQLSELVGAYNEKIEELETLRSQLNPSDAEPED